ncbi:unnamed protein product [Meganyctiphanes norvegica]|uniref:BHLH domain-containing protein n=1 Tax=Meganyctiphanes norvegica TaxID=48144 RepID=A0AAV2QD06_MEGNR
MSKISNETLDSPSKPKRPPLKSKYRRKTANARERNRMHSINTAFLSLQKAIPHLPGADNLTKITVLRLAVKYIEALATVLQDDVNLITNVEDVKDQWCMQNAHMTKSENSCTSSYHLQSNKGITKSRSYKSPKCTSSYNNKKLKINDVKCKYIKKSTPLPKRTFRSRSKLKVCQTASIETNNGAYITMKNMTTNSNQRSGKVINMEPLMINMKVKRPIIEIYINPRPPKRMKLNVDIESYTNDCTHSEVHNNIKQSTLTSFKSEPVKQEPLHGTVPFIFNISDTVCQPLNTVYPFKSEHKMNSNIPSMQSIKVKEEDKSVKSLMKSINIDIYSAYQIKCEAISCKENSTVTDILPNSISNMGETVDLCTGMSLKSEIFEPIQNEPDTYIYNNKSEFDSSRILAAPIEFTSLLEEISLDDDLEHLSSTLIADDDTISLFLNNSINNFICSSIDS